MTWSQANSALIAGALFLSVSSAPVSVRAQTVAQSPRQVTPLSQGWRFKQDDSLQGAQQPAFDDSGWASVSVPHTWNRVGYYLADGETRINTPESVNAVRGAGWYRLTFTPNADVETKRLWLQFDAASLVADVWLNGVHLGRHAGGFSRFRLDATAALQPGRPNILVVKTDNSTPTPGGPTADVLPLSGDFFIEGGLYRPVSLIATSTAHIDMLDAGGPGVYAQTKSIEGGKATVAVRTRVSNNSASDTALIVVATLRDSAGLQASSAKAPLTLKAGQTLEVSRDLILTAPRLWQGVQDPYLYTLSVEVRSAAGAVLDRLDQPFGVRQIRIDPKKGFFLNGKKLALRGVALHQDREGKGWALDAADIAEDIALIREMGANTIRLAHYQHGPVIHELADRYGLILWDEIPLVSRWTLAPGQMIPTDGLVAGARQEMTELIRQNTNHASIAVWGVANEVDFGALPAMFAGGGDGQQPDPEALLKNLNQLAKAEDPSRPTTLATCCEGDIPLATAKTPTVAPLTDVSAANRYFGWYYGQPGGFDAHLDALHAKRPDQPLAISEYGAGGALSQHTDNPLGGPVSAFGRPQPEEYQSYVHEQAWPILASKPYLWATWIWNMFDFATTIRREGDAVDINTKGLVAYDHKTRKDAFWFYKANWSSQPVVHLTGRRYVDRAFPVTDVRVYSNAPSTELLINGVLAGRQAACPDKICVWPAVRLATGDNRIQARGRFKGQTLEDTVSWSLSPDQAAGLRIDSGALMAASGGAGRYGSDAFFIGGVAGDVTPPSPPGRKPEVRAIGGAADQALLATFRKGAFVYELPLARGRYQVTLRFVEPDLAAGARAFDVLANGVTVLKAFDVAEAAGGSLKAIERTVKVQVGDGPLRLEFKPVRGEAIVSALEVRLDP